MPGESAPIHPEFLSVFWVQRPTYPLLWENLPTKVNASSYHFNIQKPTPKRWPKKRRDLPRTTRLALKSPARKQSNITLTFKNFHTIIFKFLTCSNQSLLFSCSFHSANPPTRFMSPSTNKQKASLMPHDRILLFTWPVVPQSCSSWFLTAPRWFLTPSLPPSPSHLPPWLPILKPYFWRNSSKQIPCCRLESWWSSDSIIQHPYQEDPTFPFCPWRIDPFYLHFVPIK